MKWPREAVDAAVRKARGSTVVNATPLSGGDINHAARLQTSDGPLFLKWNHRPLPGLFSAEATGLRALARATSLSVPEVVAVKDPSPDGPGFLVTTFLSPGPPDGDFDEALGLGLAELHATTRPSFGFDGDNYIGTTPQPNPATDDWIAFYGEHRLGHQVELARTAGLLSAADVKLCDRMIANLDRWLVGGRPALIHGDLWGGNVFRDRGQPALIDPAAYFAHPEAELGMMTLFGGFAEATYRAYARASGLDTGWRERNPLYQLYHLLNHANLFGGGYAGQSMRIVRRFVT